MKSFARSYVRKVASDDDASEGHDGRLLTLEEDPMSYAEAKEIALVRLELRRCWENGDHAGAGAALARLSGVVGNDNELAAEVRRWAVKRQLAA
jgi:hypothetical protein